MKEWLPQFFRKVKSRRDILVVGSSVVAASIIAYLSESHLSENSQDIKPQKPPAKPTEVEKRLDFAPSVEIGQKIDSETFKQLTTELIDFANEIDTGVKLPYHGNRDAWVRLIPFQKEGLKWGQIRLRWGIIQTSRPDSYKFDLAAKEIGLYFQKDGEEEPHLTIVGFTNEMEPTQFQPAPVVNTELGIVRPIPLSPSQMADFLHQTINFFNSRLEVGGKDKNFDVDPGKVI